VCWTVPVVLLAEFSDVLAAAAPAQPHVAACPVAV